MTDILRNPLIDGLMDFTNITKRVEKTKVYGTYIPPDATLSSSGTPVFVVEALVPDTRMKTRSGNLATLIPGITAQARIVTERSTVMQMVLRKLDFIN